MKRAKQTGHIAGFPASGGGVIEWPSPSQAEYHNQNGGSTFTVSGQRITKGYIVALPPVFTKIIAGQTQITDQDIEDFKAENLDVIHEGPHLKIGTWVHKGDTYIDLVEVVQTRAIAVELGKIRNQIEVWDIENNTGIPTGGTGKVN